MKIASWNVNSIRARAGAVLEFLQTVQPDVVCLQETKVTDEEFPSLEFQMLGYTVATAGQRSYNGVAICARSRLSEVEVGLLGHTPETDRRAIAATVNGIRIMSVYVPNGKSLESPSFEDKLAWLHNLRQTLDARYSSSTPLVVAGDFNIAADERDVFDPKRLAGRLHFHPREHQALSNVLDFGLTDAFRLHHQDGERFSWWDYRGASLRLNQGLRIDYIFMTEPVASRCTGSDMISALRHRPKPSDHIPVVAELA